MFPIQNILATSARSLGVGGKLNYQQHQCYSSCRLLHRITLPYTKHHPPTHPPQKKKFYLQMFSRSGQRVRPPGSGCRTLSSRSGLWWTSSMAGRWPWTHWSPSPGTESVRHRCLPLPETPGWASPPGVAAHPCRLHPATCCLAAAGVSPSLPCGNWSGAAESVPPRRGVCPGGVGLALDHRGPPLSSSSS